MRATYHSDTDRFELDEIPPACAHADADRLDIRFPGDVPGLPHRSFVLHRDVGARLLLHHEEAQLALHFESPDALDNFVGRQAAALADLATFCAGGAADEVVLWLAADASGLWITCVFEHDGLWSGHCVCRHGLEPWRDGSPAWPEILTFALDPNERNAMNAWRLLTDTPRGLGLHDRFPVLVASVPPPRGKRRMTVKLDAGTDWFLLMPLDIVARKGGVDSMASISEFEWIVTPKSLVRNAAERLDMVRDLSDLKTVIEHTVVVLNDYPHFGDRSRQATSMLAELLALLSSVDIQVGDRIETTGLRCLRNPSAAQIEQVLRDKSTWYVFAEFHVDKGCWQLGGEGGPMTLDWLRDGALEHVKLLRAYHCNSMFDPDRPAPASESITARLLRAGAKRVEGSTLPEKHLTFIAHLLGILCSPVGMHEVFFGKCLEQGKDLKAMLDRLEAVVGRFRPRAIS